MTAAFFRLHADLPREGPGDRDSLDWAVQTAGLPADARILDAGCGPGADIEGLLAAAPSGRIVAVDIHAPFIEAVKARWGDEPRVTAVVGDMATQAGSWDMVWSAGALYFHGIAAGLELFRPQLAPGGVVAFSELVWLVDAPSAGLRNALEAEYPPIGGLGRLKTRIAAAGYDICDMRVLSDAAWEAYYTPLDARVRRLRPGADPALAKVLDDAETEIALWRTNRLCFGYALSVVRPA